jgi:pSer/pThr/pTyr-binding forkhead associated (FHA) protein
MLFCVECGARLFEARTDNILEQRRQVHFVVPGSGRRQAVFLSLSETVAIGRADPENGYWPQIDLTEDNGLHCGVSRRHAVIQLSGDEVVLIDKESANGTWIDGLKLESERPYRLPPSGRLRFGSLEVYLYLE